MQGQTSEARRCRSCSTASCRRAGVYILARALAQPRPTLDASRGRAGPRRPGCVRRGRRPRGLRGFLDPAPAPDLVHGSPWGRQNTNARAVRPGRPRSTSLCKPSSVSRPGHPGRGGNHSSRATVARRLEQPTRRLGRAALVTPAYMALLPMGFAVPSALPRARWALTPPFHPCRRRVHGARGRRRSVLCGTLLGVSATGRYPASCSVELGLSSRRCIAAGRRSPERRRRRAMCTLERARATGRLEGRHGRQTARRRAGPSDAAGSALAIDPRSRRAARAADAARAERRADRRARADARGPRAHRDARQRCSATSRRRGPPPCSRRR